MKLNSMSATFGKLDRARLELGEGLNLIYAPNEGGKSTWAAFWKAMLYGIDTRDRDRKGYLADKNHYQPWSGAPMEGELTLEWQGRDITIRRGPKGSTPFGSFSAVYTGTEEPVPGLTADNCGQMLTGVGREVFERSAFLGSGGNLAVTAAPELERRIAALVSSGEEDVSYSQTESRLREWLNRRKVNRSVGLIPKLEGALEQVRASLAQLEEVTAELAQLEGARSALEEEVLALEGEKALHRRLAQKDLNRRFAQAAQELDTAQTQLSALEGEAAKYGAPPDRELLKKAQGELQYLKVLDEEIREAETALHDAEEAYVQTQIAAQDPRFQGMSGEEASARAQKDIQEHTAYRDTAQAKSLGAKLFPAFGLVFALSMGLFGLIREGRLLTYPLYVGLFILALTLVVGLVNRSNAKAWLDRSDGVFARYGVQTSQDLEALVGSYRTRTLAADEAALRARTLRGALNDRTARRDNSRNDLLNFVHTFAPQVTDLFGCSAALSRALNLEYDLAVARERVAERRCRREDLSAQGGQVADTLELLQPPERSPQETDEALAGAAARLSRVNEARNQALGRQAAMGDPAALAARQEELEEELARRQTEYDALTLAMEALKEANTRLQERFSPELNRLSGQYMARLTGEAYSSVSLTRELEGAAARPGDVLPRSVLYLSRGTADQLYLAVRLAVCALCLPQRPPILLDDALAAFDDSRLRLALELLLELAQGQQILLFTCQRREGAALEGVSGPARLEL
ncbi:MAG: AAA family ATPase [Lawsonibacter sp.]